MMPQQKGKGVSRQPVLEAIFFPGIDWISAKRNFPDTLSDNTVNFGSCSCSGWPPSVFHASPFNKSKRGFYGIVC
jgi:hypothetical protein